METLIAARLTEELERNRAIADSQYGFRAGRFTVDAILEVVRTVEAERQKIENQAVLLGDPS